MTALAELVRKAKRGFDLTDPGDRESLLRLTSELVERADLSGESIQAAAQAPGAPSNSASPRSWSIRAAGCSETASR
ncbi:MAG: hypothetical protein CL910_13480 [Deltaproteobacteria bacterium]|nr:hypothetical protein [Deltaproteobacteria bacterium]